MTLPTLYVIVRGGDTLRNVNGRPFAYHDPSVAARDAAEWPGAEVVPYEAAPPMTGAEFLDAIHEAIPDAFSDLDDVLGDVPSMKETK